MSAAPSQPLALPPLMPAALPVVPLADHAHELLAARLTALGAVACAAVVAVGSLRLTQLWREKIAEDLWARAAQEQLRLREVKLTLRTLHLVAAGEYAAAVDALEAHAVETCEDCWETALDARQYVRCAGCSARAEVDAPVVVDDVLVIDAEPEVEPFDVLSLLDPNGATLDNVPARPGPVRCDAAMQGATLVGVRW